MKRTYTDKYPEAIIQSKKEKEAREKQVAAVIDPNETKNVQKNSGTYICWRVALVPGVRDHLLMKPVNVIS